MSDAELNRVLRSAAVPERDAGYWDRFSREVTARIRATAETLDAWPKVLPLPRERARVKGGVRYWKSALAFSLAAACIALAFFLGFWKDRSASEDPQLAAIQKCYREIESLFPNQLQVLAFDKQGAHLSLADSPTVPGSSPLYLKICGPSGCQRFVTFSGQQIRIASDTLEVLLNHRGEVLLVGPQWVWSSAQPASVSRYRIEAKPLPAAS